MTNYSLKQATQDDQKFLFNVVQEAMAPVRESNKKPETLDIEKAFNEYKEKYPFEEVQVIQFDSKDVGRLRVVRSDDKIYIGGIQILPQFQGKGIGTSIMKDLIDESNKLKIPITLEVHDVNISAKSFYSKLGFKVVKHVKDQSVLEYSPLLES